VSVSTDTSELPLAMAVSDDGRVAAAAWHDSDVPLKFTVRAYDVATGALLLERTPGAAFGQNNYAGDVALSADGSRLAVGSWGNGSSGPAELVVYDPWNDVKLASFPVNGSVFDVELSADGSRLLAQRIGNHASQGHNQKLIGLYELGGADLSAVGVPALDETVQLDVWGPVGAPALLLLAADLAPSPLPSAGAGWLLLDPDTLLIVDAGVVGPGGSSSLALAVPPVPAIVGLSLFFQGAVAAPLALGETSLKLTALP
jgi:hypothetical protein